MCDESANYKDYNEAVGYWQECDKCGCQFTHWENTTYEPYCVEVGGAEYEYPRPPDGDAQVLDVLAEFVTDVEAAYGGRPEDDVEPPWEELEAEWPDLLVTYRKAKVIVAKAKENEEILEGEPS